MENVILPASDAVSNNFNSYKSGGVNTVYEREEGKKISIRLCINI